MRESKDRSPGSDLAHLHTDELQGGSGRSQLGSVLEDRSSVTVFLAGDHGLELGIVRLSSLAERHTKL